MANILVTGGTGFIGFHLVKHLLTKKHNVTLIDNLFRSELDEEFESIKNNVNFIQADLTKPLDDLPLTQYDHVFHLAAINGVKYANNNPDKVLRTNLLATINVLDWCVKNPPKSFVFASSSEAYHSAFDWMELPIPTSENVPLVISNPDVNRYSYAGSKITGELLTLNYAKMHGFNARVVRYHNIYGPRMGYDHVIPELIMRMEKNESPFKLYGAGQTRAFCYVEDAVRATYEIGVFPGDSQHIANVGNDKEEIEIRDLCNRLFQLNKYKASIEEVPASPGSPNRRCPDIQKLKDLIDYNPTVSLDEGLAITFEWYKKRLSLTV
ncbi:NAD-dependent epimerase/dehydratase family protein [Priestia koreensis]|uniref:NAD-dependent epimerase/dehydratase family protein n=1 Tax=Priestia koreensis TaxID=284581 RepID=UPI003D02FE83